MDNSYYKVFKKRGEQPLNGWIYIIVLFLSFVWSSFFIVESSVTNYSFMSYGKLFNVSSPNFFYEVTTLIFMSVIYLLAFELIFYLYRFIISFKVYSFIIPLERFKADARITYAYRNVFYGIYLNLCFLYPYLYSYAMLASLAITMVMFISFARKIYRIYAEPLIAQFVFKTFMYPVFFYEALSVLLSVWGLF